MIKYLLLFRNEMACLIREGIFYYKCTEMIVGGFSEMTRINSCIGRGTGLHIFKIPSTLKILCCHGLNITQIKHRAFVAHFGDTVKEIQTINCNTD